VSTSTEPALCLHSSISRDLRETSILLKPSVLNMCPQHMYVIKSRNDNNGICHII
jgi:hypothetical protein